MCNAQNKTSLPAERGWLRVLACGCALVAALMGALYAVAPFFVDDLWYSLGADGIADPMERAAVVWTNVVDHLQWDTGRLANILSPIFLALLPKWAFGVVAAMAVWITLTLGVKYVGKSPMAGAVWVAFYILCMPWLDHLVAVIYGLNYVCTSALAVVVLWAAARLSSAEGVSRRLYPWLCVAAFAAGWMHEGFSVPMAAGFFVYNCAVCWRVPRRLLVMQVCMVAGLIVLASFPALWTRSADAVNPLMQKPLMEVIVDAGVFNCMFWLYAASCAWLWLRGRVESRAESAEMLMILTFGVVGTAVMMVYYFGPRTSWFLQQVCGLGLLRLMCRHWRPNCPRWVAPAAVCVSITLCIVNVSAAITAQVKLTREMDEVVEAYRESPDGVVYSDIMMPGVDLTLMKTSVRNLMVRVPLAFIRSYVGREEPLVILPEAMRDFDPAQAREVGRIPFPVYEHRGSLVAASADVDYPALLIDYQGLGPTVTRFRASEFTLRGDTFTLLQPHVSVMLGFPLVQSVSLPE